MTAGTFQCLEESGGSGAGNPESNTCFVTFNQSTVLNKKLPYVLQLEERDAILYVGCNPAASEPPLYYGWSPYLFGFDLLHGLRGIP